MPPTEQTCSALTTASVERSNSTTTLATGRDLREWVGYQFMYVHILHSNWVWVGETTVCTQWNMQHTHTCVANLLPLSLSHTHHTSHLLSHNTYLNRTTAELSGAPMARSEETKKRCNKTDSSTENYMQY